MRFSSIFFPLRSTDARRVLFVRQKHLRCHTYKGTTGAFEWSYSAIRMRRNLSRIFSTQIFGPLKCYILLIYIFPHNEWIFKFIPNSGIRSTERALNIVFIVQSFKRKRGIRFSSIHFLPFEALRRIETRRVLFVRKKCMPLPLYQLVTATVCCTDYTPAPGIVSPSFNSSL